MLSILILFDYKVFKSSRKEQFDFTPYKIEPILELKLLNEFGRLGQPGIPSTTVGFHLKNGILSLLVRCFISIIVLFSFEDSRKIME